MDEIKPKYGYDPFPKSGIHWTQLAAYPATLEIIKAINSAKGRTAILPYEIAVGPAEKPFIEDYDYGHLLNVFWMQVPKDTATFTVTTPAPAPAPCPAPVTILMVGGSFFQALGTNLSRSPCPPGIAQLFYLSLDTYRYESGQCIPTGKPDYELLKRTDIIILEENIGLLPAGHISHFHKYLRAGQPPSDRAGLAGE